MIFRPVHVGSLKVFSLQLVVFHKNTILDPVLGGLISSLQGAWLVLDGIQEGSYISSHSLIIEPFVLQLMPPIQEELPNKGIRFFPTT